MAHHEPSVRLSRITLGGRGVRPIGWVAAKGAGSAFGAGQGVGALQFATAAVKWLPV